MLTEHSTLARFLIEERRRHPGSSGELNSLILDIAVACKAISSRIASGALSGVLGKAGTINVQGEQQQHLDRVANDMFLRATAWGGQLCGMVSEELETPYPIPPAYPRGKYLLAFDPLDGSSNIDVNVAVGSIFSILRAATPGRDATVEDFLRPGHEIVAAGYAIYGPSTVLVLSVGRGVHAFTLDPQLGEFFLTEQDVTIPSETAEFAVNSSNRRFWERPVSRYIDECLAGVSGPRGKDFNMRWVASLVAETHRILTRGGVFLYPTDTKDPAMKGRLRLLYEAAPVAFLVEQAGGSATTGRERVLDVVPEDIHERIGLIFGSRDEVERLAHYHAHPEATAATLPFYGLRGLYRAEG